MWEVLGKTKLYFCQLSSPLSLLPVSEMFLPSPVAFGLLQRQSQSLHHDSHSVTCPLWSFFVFDFAGLTSHSILNSPSTRITAEVSLVPAPVLLQLPSPFCVARDGFSDGDHWLPFHHIWGPRPVPGPASSPLCLFMCLSHFFISAFASRIVHNGNSMNLWRLLLTSSINTVGRENLSLIASPSWEPHLRHGLGCAGRPRAHFSIPQYLTPWLCSHFFSFSPFFCGYLIWEQGKTLALADFLFFFFWGRVIFFSEICFWNTPTGCLKFYPVFCCESPPFRCYTSFGELSDKEFYWEKENSEFRTLIPVSQHHTAA